MQSLVYIVIGVSGCGKDPVGRALAAALEIPFYDAADFFSEIQQKKVEKLRPFDGEEIKEWLVPLGVKVSEWADSKGAVLSCPALTQRHRDLLSNRAQGSILFIWLDASDDILVHRHRDLDTAGKLKKLQQEQREIMEPPMDALRINLDTMPDPVEDCVVRAILQYMQFIRS